MTFASRAAWIGGLLGAVALLAGCTTTSSGLPSPAGSATIGTSTGAKPSSSTSEPRSARPREIRLDGRNPCTLVPESDWPKFHIDKPGKLGEEPTFKSPDCFYGTNFVALDVVLVVTEGIDRWINGSRSGIVEKVEPVEGFPAIAITRREDKNQCDVAVDVANGQYLLTGVVLIPSKASQLPERCDYARQLAESTMTTLVRL